MAEQQGNTTIGTNMDLQEATVQAFKTSLRGARRARFTIPRLTGGRH
jgi:hypothetical protein